MPKVIGYTFEADIHCIACSVLRFSIEREYRVTDENCIRYDQKDCEGNNLHPIFNTDEAPINGYRCGDCGEEL